MLFRPAGGRKYYLEIAPSTLEFGSVIHNLAAMIIVGKGLAA